MAYCWKRSQSALFAPGQQCPLSILVEFDKYYQRQIQISTYGETEIFKAGVLCSIDLHRYPHDTQVVYRYRKYQGNYQKIIPMTHRCKIKAKCSFESVVMLTLFFLNFFLLQKYAQILYFGCYTDKVAKGEVQKKVG